MKGSSLELSTSRKIIFQSYSKSLSAKLHFSWLLLSTQRALKTCCSLQRCPSCRRPVCKGREDQPKPKQELGCSWKPSLKSPFGKQLQMSPRYPFKPHFCHQQIHEGQESSGNKALRKPGPCLSPHAISPLSMFSHFPSHQLEGLHALDTSRFIFP